MEFTLQVRLAVRDNTLTQELTDKFLEFWHNCPIDFELAFYDRAKKEGKYDTYPIGNVINPFTKEEKFSTAAQKDTFCDIVYKAAKDMQDNPDGD